MKTTQLFLVFLFFCSFPLFAQNDWTKEEVTKITANFNLYEDTFEIISKYKLNSEFAIQFTSVELIDKEIIISYTSLLPEGGEYFKPSISFRMNNEQLEVVPENLFGAVQKEMTFTEELEQHQIIWTNLTKEYIELKGQLEITLSVEIFGTRQLPYDVDCGIKPTFTNKQKMPFYTAGIVGAGSLVAGQLLERKAQTDYEDLYRTQKSETDAEPFYQDANGTHHTAFIMTYAGAAILAVDAIWFFIKQRRYKKQLDTYNEFCNPELSIRPFLENNSPNNFALQPGLRLKYNF